MILEMTLTPAQVSTRPPLWRVKHDLELGGVWRPGLPEVHPMFPNHYAPFGRSWQLASRALNPLFSDNKWTHAYDTDLWIANKQGFDLGRVNYVTGENIGAAPPKVEMLTCGGNILTGEVIDDYLYVEVLDYHDEPPSTGWLLSHPWFITYGVSADGFGNPRRFPANEVNGVYVPFRHPLLGDPDQFPMIVIELSKLQRWTAVDLPDPYRLYLV